MNMWRLATHWLGPPKERVPSNDLEPKMVYRSDKDGPITWAEMDQINKWFVFKLDSIEQKLDELLKRK